MPEEPLHNPHDRFFKETLGRRTAAAGFFEEYLPSALSKELDWSGLERQEGGFVDETLSERHADLLFTVPWKNGEIFLYCLFEHQSSQDEWMSLRLLRYMVRIWERQIRDEPGRRTLAPILPIVLHQSDGAWKVSKRFGSLLELPKEHLGELGQFIPDFQYHLVDLADLPIEELRGGVLVRTILATMKVARQREWADRLAKLAPLLSGVLTENDVGFVKVCLEYLMRGSDEVDLRQFRAKLEQVKIGEIKEHVMTLADQLIKEGREEGRQEGRIEGRRENILDILEARFGAVPGDLRDRIEGLDDEALLKALHRHAALAGSLEEFRGKL